MKTNRRTLLKLAGISSIGSLVGFGLNAQNACLSTEDILGPFYIAGAPFIQQLAPEGAAGVPIVITGTVYANDCMTPLVDAVVDVWHANDAGDYENVDYRGKMKTDESGNYSFQSILPGKYLNGAQFRPRHFHYKVSFEEVELTTQIYFEGDTSIPSDPWASSEEAIERIISITEDANGVLHGVADIYLDVDPPIIDRTTDLTSHQKASIRNIFPNPLKEEGQIQFYLAQAGQVQIQIYNIQGQKVIPNLVDAHFPIGDHAIPIHSNSTYGIKLSNGIYVVQLLLDQTIVDAKRFLIA